MITAEKTIQEKVSEIIKNCTRHILESRIKDSLEALVLVGSFSRNEGLVCQNNGILQFLSDIEFWAVVNQKDFSNIHNRCRDIEKIIQERLMLENLDIKVSLRFTTKNHLKRLKPYIFTLEVKKFGQVLWGDINILNYIPEYSYEDLDSLDGFILINNRIVEQLMLLDKIQENKSIHQYECDKGYIQIMNSLLVFKKKYRGFYNEKWAESVKVLQGIDYLTIKIPDLASKIRSALGRLNNLDYKTFHRDEALSEWEELRKYFKETWLYEVRTLVKNNNCNLQSAIRQFTFIPDFKARLKG